MSGWVCREQGVLFRVVPTTRLAGRLSDHSGRHHKWYGGLRQHRTGDYRQVPVRHHRARPVEHAEGAPGRGRNLYLHAGHGGYGLLSGVPVLSRPGVRWPAECVADYREAHLPVGMGELYSCVISCIPMGGKVAGILVYLLQRQGWADIRPGHRGHHHHHQLRYGGVV